VTDELKPWFNTKTLALGVIFVVIVTSVYVFSNAPKYEAYSRFGFSFEYPDGMEMREEGIGGFSIATISARARKTRGGWNRSRNACRGNARARESRRAPIRLRP
jgi:hypothetical protein